MINNNNLISKKKIVEGDLLKKLHDILPEGKRMMYNTNGIIYMNYPP